MYKGLYYMKILMPTEKMPPVFSLIFLIKEWNWKKNFFLFMILDVFRVSPTFTGRSSVDAVLEETHSSASPAVQSTKRATVTSICPTEVAFHVPLKFGESYKKCT